MRTEIILKTEIEVELKFFWELLLK